MRPLFTPLRLRNLELRNRIVVSPMCQYSCVADDGVPHDWHLVHLGARAVGGAGLVVTEATAVVPEGRISQWDTGLWNDEQAAAWARIVAFVHAQGAAAGVQLAHAGRKASTRAPWLGRGRVPADEGWEPVAPSPVPFADGDPPPRPLKADELPAVAAAFVAATRRALAAGFDLVELHLAHGYLAHQFLSPLSNRRTDDYGGGLENRMRLPLEIARAVRAEWPRARPLFARVSATDWVDGGWTLDDTIVFAGGLAAAGVDLVVCSSGGTSPAQRVPESAGFQVPFAGAVRRDAGVATGAVGLITQPPQADAIVAAGDADVVVLARELLRDPHWPLRAAHELRVDAPWPKQYERARRLRPARAAERSGGVALRRATVDDLDFLVELYNADDVEPFLGGRGARGLDALREEIERSLAEPRAFGRFVIEVDGARAGALGFHELSERHGIARLEALAVHPSYRGRRIADEAARLVQRLLLLELGYHRLELAVYGFNARAAAHAERSGFVREGVRRKAYLRHGEWQDAIEFGLVREDLPP